MEGVPATTAKKSLHQLSAIQPRLSVRTTNFSIISLKNVLISNTANAKLLDGNSKIEIHHEKENEREAQTLLFSYILFFSPLKHQKSQN